MDKRIPSLDGARAVSIILVIASHFLWGRTLPVLWRIDYGNLGVRIFFVISGFLITSLLIKEHERTGGISLKGFYLRRFSRLAPAYYAYTLSAIALVSAGLIEGSYHDLAPALLYYSNYKHVDWVFGMTWSLSVEEQFYALWPPIIVMLGLARARYACLALLLIAPAFRVLWDLRLWLTPHNMAFEFVCDALAAGCALALFRESLWRLSAYRVATACAIPILVAALIYMALQPGPIARDVISLPFLNIAIAISLDAAMRWPKAGSARLLNWRPIAWLGTISYSLYLWQEPFTYGNSLLVMIRVGCMLACASASYYWIERPFLRLRARISEWSSRTIPQPSLPP